MNTQAQAKLFRSRLIQACDAHPNIPNGHGRKTWLKEQLSWQGVDVTLQAVLNWFEGKTNPRPEARAALAKVLGVTEAALIGIETMKPADDSQAIEAVNVSVHLSDGRPVEIRGLPLKLDQREHDRLSKELEAYVSN
jgi:transcriptional regulator with XRE-family HTH domain